MQAARSLTILGHDVAPAGASLPRPRRRPDNVTWQSFGNPPRADCLSTPVDVWLKISFTGHLLTSASGESWTSPLLFCQMQVQRDVTWADRKQRGLPVLRHHFPWFCPCLSEGA